ncbi:hypothetical protein [Natrinema halophilum]|uniref:Uncharacterized protein n=1 Tax=Natrinema halophilum TaxID=1699371 RepID=A0A7D5KWK0_9EURY|nr:hypothetical protein [Natrinema halophilum]QLG47622.1 hypothetical protein HYG82_01555 [Natrinema halophilum]
MNEEFVHREEDGQFEPKDETYERISEFTESVLGNQDRVREYALTKTLSKLSIQAFALFFALAFYGMLLEYDIATIPAVIPDVPETVILPAAAACGAIAIVLTLVVLALSKKAIDLDFSERMLAEYHLAKAINAYEEDNHSTSITHLRKLDRSLDSSFSPYPFSNQAIISPHVTPAVSTYVANISQSETPEESLDRTLIPFAVTLIDHLSDQTHQRINSLSDDVAQTTSNTTIASVLVSSFSYVAFIKPIAVLVTWVTIVLVIGIHFAQRIGPIQGIATVVTLLGAPQLADYLFTKVFKQVMPYSHRVDTGE